MAKVYKAVCMASARRLTVLTTLLALAAPVAAQAYVTDVAPLAGAVGGDSSSTKSFVASCPTGDNPLSVGAAVSHQGKNLALQGAIPSGPMGPGGLFAVSGSETDPFAGNWSLLAQPICAVVGATQPDVASSAPFVKAVQIVHVQSERNSEDKSVTAACPAGKTAIGGGGDVDGGGEDVAIIASAGFGANGNFTPPYKKWRVYAEEQDPTDAAWQVEAKVVCANVSTTSDQSDYADNVTTFLYLSFGSGGPTSHGLQSATAPCPPGQRVIGGGAVAVSGTPPGKPSTWGTQHSGWGPASTTAKQPAAPNDFPTAPPDVALTNSQPVGDSNHPQAWTAEAVETDPTNHPWFVAVQVVCADLTAGPSTST